MQKNKLKKEITNHIFKSGKKQRNENFLKISIKSIQKCQKKSHNEIIKLTMLNSIPTFKVIKLKKKKSKIEIPIFISSIQHRISWGIKYLVQICNSETKLSLNQKLQKTFLLNVTLKPDTLKFKDELQKNALENKNYFKYYKW